MCGRFYIADEDETGEIQRMIDEAARKQQRIIGESTIRAGEIGPGMAAPAVALGKRGDTGVFPMQWGFAMNGKTVINTRLETAAQKPLFRDAFLQRRCLLPLTCYFEWQQTEAAVPSLLEEALAPRQKKRIRYAIRPEEKGRMFLAGIYRHEGEGRLPVFSVLTCAPGDSIAWLHDRMPVILPEKEALAFLRDPGAAAGRVDKMTWRRDERMAIL